MSNYDEDIYTEPDYSGYGKKEVRKSNSAVYIIIISVLFIGLLAMAYLYFFNKSSYEKGMEYLTLKQYDAAVTEFQKVPPTNGDFNKAQSKIDYINGVKLFNENKYPDAKVYLQKVNPTDEFYNEVKLMMDRITSYEKENELKEQLEQDEQRKIAEAQKETEQKIKDNETSKKYLMFLIRSEDKFESEFQLALLENAVTMKKNLRNLTSLRQEMLDESYSAVNPDQELSEYKNMLSKWMSSRISFVQMAIEQNVLSPADVTPETVAIRTEGDRMKEKINEEKEKLKKAYSINS